MYDFEPILSRLKAVKESSGLTNQELSDKSGVPYGTIIKILSGNTLEPKLPAMMAIAAALGTSVDYLVYGNNSSAQSITLDNDETELIADYRDAIPPIRTAAAIMLHDSAEEVRKEKSAAGCSAG